MKKTKAVSGILEEVLSALGLSSVTRMVRLSSAWPDIAGPLLAGKTAPAKLKNGVLTVLVRNHSWAQELQLGKTVLLARINSFMETEKIQDIRFVVGPIPGPDDKEEENPRREKPPSFTPPVAEPEGIDGIGDPETREILRSLSRKAACRGRLP
ncbi:MAG: DUF721 domain-containing protein [Deltaproteobacteria bacterium]|nr:DUF721 domain-containing protein [Deltaproteobacteria bacterium]